LLWHCARQTPSRVHTCPLGHSVLYTHDRSPVRAVQMRTPETSPPVHTWLGRQSASVRHGARHACATQRRGLSQSASKRH